MTSKKEQIQLGNKLIGIKYFKARKTAYWWLEIYFLGWYYECSENGYKQLEFNIGRKRFFRIEIGCHGIWIHLYWNHYKQYGKWI